MTKTIFFSWQTDTPSRVGRSFLGDVLRRVCAELTDSSVNESGRDEVVVDSDTQGISGHPSIVDTIFRKIDSSHVFVADMTLFGSRVEGRLTPNPNVLVEYGWALKSLSSARLVFVMNSAYGGPGKNGENLPFDLRHVRWPIQFELPENAEPEFKHKVRKQLATQLRTAIKACLETIPDEPIQEPAPYQEQEEHDGPSCFRRPGEPIGSTWDSFPFLKSDRKERFLSNGPLMWLRVIPTSDPKKNWAPDELRQAAQRGLCLLPFVQSGSSYLRAGDGFGVHPGRDEGDTLCSVAFAFETGEVWSIDTFFCGIAGFPVPLVDIWERYQILLGKYAEFLGNLGIAPPYKWSAGFRGVMNRPFLIPPNRNSVVAFSPGTECLVDVVRGDGRFSPGDDPRVSLRGFFETLCRRCGMSLPAYM